MSGSFEAQSRVSVTPSAGSRVSALAPRIEQCAFRHRATSSALTAAALSFIRAAEVTVSVQLLSGLQ